MNVKRFQNSNLISYNGIKLSTDNYVRVRDFVEALKFRGACCAGHKTYEVGTDMNSKIRVADYVRSRYLFGEKEFGVIFLPNSHESYMLAQPKFEQELLKTVQILDKNAHINLCI